MLICVKQTDEKILDVLGIAMSLSLTLSLHSLGWGHFSVENKLTHRTKDLWETCP